jgi:hypothetical protein
MGVMAGASSAMRLLLVEPLENHHGQGREGDLFNAVHEAAA